MKRAFPLHSGLALPLLAGCRLLQDPIVDTWELQWINGIEPHFTESDDGCSYSYTKEVLLRFNESLSHEITGAMVESYSLTFACDGAEQSIHSDATLDITHVTSPSERCYLLTLPDDEMRCTLVIEDELFCEYHHDELSFFRD